MKVTETWYSERLGREVSVTRWGEMGVPFLIYPTAGGDHEEIERFLFIDTVAEYLAIVSKSPLSMERVVKPAKASRALLGVDAEKPITDDTPTRNAAAATGWGLMVAFMCWKMHNEKCGTYVPHVPRYVITSKPGVKSKDTCMYAPCMPSTTTTQHTT